MSKPRSSSEIDVARVDGLVDHGPGLRGQRDVERAALGADLELLLEVVRRPRSRRRSRPPALIRSSTSVWSASPSSADSAFSTLTLPVFSSVAGVAPSPPPPPSPSSSPAHAAATSSSATNGTISLSCRIGDPPLVGLRTLSPTRVAPGQSTFGAGALPSMCTLTRHASFPWALVEPFPLHTVLTRSTLALRSEGLHVRSRPRTNARSASERVPGSRDPRRPGRNAVRSPAPTRSCRPATTRSTRGAGPPLRRRRRPRRGDRAGTRSDPGRRCCRPRLGHPRTPRRSR